MKLVYCISICVMKHKEKFRLRIEHLVIKLLLSKVHICWFFPFAFTTDREIANNFWTHTPLSFKYVWFLFSDPLQTTHQPNIGVRLRELTE